MQKGSLILAVCTCLSFLTPVSPQCRTGTVAECEGHVEFVPGFYLAEKGIDITALEVNHFSHYNVYDHREWQTQGGSCTVCENPFLTDYFDPSIKELQKLPLAITDWKANISCQQKVHHSGPLSVILLAAEVTKLYVKNDWKTGLNFDAQFSAAQWILSGPDNFFTSYFKRKNALDKYIFFLHQASCSYYKFRINNNSVSDTFKDHVNLLPQTYDRSSKLEYHRLINDYGTHVITEVDLGVGAIFLSALPLCMMHLKGVTVSEINHCLELEVSIIIGLKNVTQDPILQKCQKTLEDIIGTDLSKNQMRILQGGLTSIASVFFNIHFKKDPKQWWENAKSHPGLLSYSLAPLHTLVDINDPRRASLQQAESKYVEERALWSNCTHSCPPGVQRGAWDSCSCQCPNNNLTNSMCCAQKWGVAKLSVTIVGAIGLWGDYITQSDGYVKMFRDYRFVMSTHAVWNNNNPEWNVYFDFGIIEVDRGLPTLELQVWDQDFGWDDDLLGKCISILEPWAPTDHFCYLDHGRLHYQYHLTCGPKLGGMFCSHYMTPGIFSQHKAKADMVKESIP